jgi:hypothetical protein
MGMKGDVSYCQPPSRNTVAILSLPPLESISRLAGNNFPRFIFGKRKPNKCLQNCSFLHTYTVYYAIQTFRRTVLPTQRRLFKHRHFWTSYLFHLQGSSVLSLTLDPWRWKRQVIPKRRCLSNLLCVITQKTEEFRQRAEQTYDFA